jgi:hypothetical protein
VSQVRREFDLRHTLFLQLLYPVIVIIRDCRGERLLVNTLPQSSYWKRFLERRSSARL